SADNRAKGTATISLFFDLGLMLLCPLFGWIFDLRGAETMFALSGTLLLGACAIVLGVHVMRRRNRHTPPSRQTLSVRRSAATKTRILATATLHPLAVEYLHRRKDWDFAYHPHARRQDILNMIDEFDILLCRVETEV